MAPGLAITFASSDAWPEMGAQAERGLNTGWVLDQRADGAGGFTVNTSPSSSGLTFTSSGDGTTGSGNGYYTIGRPVRILQAGSSAYAKVSAASVAAGITTITLGSFSTLGSTALSTGAITSAGAGAQIRHFNTSGDLIYGSSNAVPTILPIGTATFTLQSVAGLPAWAAPTPMNTSGDLIYGTSGGIAARLAAGAADTVLSMVSGLPAWRYPALVTTAEASLGADVTLTTAGTFYDGPSVSLAAGTWLIFAQAVMTGTASNGFNNAGIAKLWDGSTVEVSGETAFQQDSGGGPKLVTVTLIGIVSPVGTTTYKVSCTMQGTTFGAGTLLAATADSGSGNNATRIVAVRIA